MEAALARAEFRASLWADRPILDRLASPRPRFEAPAAERTPSAHLAETERLVITIPPPPPGGGGVFAPLYKRAAPPLGFYPARSPRLASRTPGLSPLDHGGGGRLRSAPQACGAAAWALPARGPRPRRFASRAPWARLGPPVSLSSTTVAAVVFAPLRKHVAPQPGLYPARGPGRASGSPPRFSGPMGPARIPRSFPSISVLPFVRAGRPGPPLQRSRSAVTTSGGNVCSAPPVGGAVLAPLYKGRRRSRGPTWRAARASPLLPSGPVVPARTPTVAVVVSAPLRKRAAPQTRGAAAGALPGARPASPPLRF